MSILSGESLQSRCSESESVDLYNSGYITSPNYPDKYYMDAECRWTVHVQRRQAISVTLLDFELDVKRGGRCYDYLEISAGDRTFFRDCGALGRQIVEIDTSCSHVTVTFRTGQTSLTQRGFLLHFEGSFSTHVTILRTLAIMRRFNREVKTFTGLNFVGKLLLQVVQWLSGRAFDLRSLGCGFDSHREKC